MNNFSAEKAIKEEQQEIASSGYEDGEKHSDKTIQTEEKGQCIVGYYFHPILIPLTPIWSWFYIELIFNNEGNSLIIEERHNFECKGKIKKGRCKKSQ